MRALVLSSEFPPGPGGIGTHACHLARSLERLGWHVTVVAPQDYADAELVAEFNAAQPFRIRSAGQTGSRLRRGVRRVRATLGALHTSSPDVIVASGAASVLLAALIAFRRPVVAFAHGSEVATTDPVRRFLARASFRRVDLIICQSELTRSRLCALGVASGSVVVVPLGADAETFAPVSGRRATEFRKRIGVGTASMILTVGTVSERKGQDLVVRSLRRLSAHYDVHYVCIGREADPGRLSAWATELGLADRVHVLGQLPDAELLDAYAACDVFALVSRETLSGDVEGFGIAAVEAAMCERPVVVSDAAGVAESIERGVTGLVVAADDLRATESALDELLASPDRRREMGVAARRKALATQTWEQLGVRYDGLLQRTVTTRQGERGRGSRLVVVSDTPHFRRPDGQLVGWGPTVRELDRLATLFEELVHVAPVHDCEPPPIARPYESDRVRVRAVRPAGGVGLRAKLGVLGCVPSWARAVSTELRTASAVHVRCPANIDLIALLLLGVVRQPVPRWVKYGGNWAPTSGEPVSYRFQRWLLRSHWCRAEVTVNGAWPSQPSHVHPFVNPTLTDDELRAGSHAAAFKTLDRELRLLFVGRLNDAKGAGRVVEIVEQLVAIKLVVRLEVVGDGPARRRYESEVRRRGLTNHVTFHGWLDRAALDRLYAAAHVVLLPSVSSEGFPKVLAEGMAYGAVPVAGDISCIAEELGAARSGAVLPATDVDAFVLAVAELTRPGRWKADSEAAVEAASRYTYDRYLDAVRELFRTSWGVELPEEESSSPAQGAG